MTTISLKLPEALLQESEQEAAARGVRRAKVCGNPRQPRPHLAERAQGEKEGDMPGTHARRRGFIPRAK